MIATIEDVKKYWDDRPCNVRHSDKELGTREYFDEVENEAKEILKVAKIKNNMMDSIDILPVAIAQPITGGKAPAAPPITIF